MSKFLAVDWDSVEVRFVLGNITKENLVVLKAGAAPIQTWTDDSDAITNAVAETPSDISDEAENDANESDDASSLAELNERLLREINESTRNPSPNVASSEVSPPSNVADSSERPVVVTQPSSDDENESEGDAERSAQTPDPGAILKKLLKENRIGSATLLFCVGRSDVEVLSMNLPIVADAELPEMVKNQVLRDSSTYIDGQPLDFLVLGPAAQPAQQRIMTVSTTRVQLKNLRTRLAIASRKPAKLECRGTAISEFLLSGKLAWTDEDQNRYENVFRNVVETTANDDESTLLKTDRFADDYLDSSDERRAILLVQELCDEVNFVLFDEKPIYLRSFKIQSDLSEESRIDRLSREIVRTIAVGINDSTSRSVDRVFFFGRENEQESLRTSLQKQGIYLKTVNPFELPGVVCRTEEPRNPGRFAALLGAVLAERPQRRPLIDLLHPHEKPKPPNYALFVASLVFLSILAGAAAWFWNQSGLRHEADELAKLEQQRDELAAQIQLTTPLGRHFQILSSAYAWDNRFGVVVLDELRDIMLRIPAAPNLVVDQLSYAGNLRNNRPAFIISAKVSSVAVYQQFYQALTRDRSHQVVSSGVRPNPGGGGFTHEFTAQIYCMRRPFNQYWQTLPQELKKVSNNLPEFFQLQRQNIVRPDVPQNPVPNPNASNVPQNPVPNPEASNVPQNPVPNPDAPSVPQNPVPSPDAPNVPQNPAPSPDAPNVPQDPAPSPDASSVPQNPVPNLDAPNVPQNPVPNPDASNVPQNPVPNPDASSVPQNPVPNPDASSVPQNPDPNNP